MSKEEIEQQIAIYTTRFKYYSEMALKNIGTLKAHYLAERAETNELINQLYEQLEAL